MEFENPVQIKLKRKYLRGFRSRFQGGESAAPKKKRTKIGFQKHADRYGVPPNVVLHVDGRTGKSLLVKTSGGQK